MKKKPNFSIQIFSALLWTSFFVIASPLEAQTTNLNVENGTTMNIMSSANYANTYIGSNTSSNTLQVYRASGATANVILSNSSGLFVGRGGSQNSMFISNGSTVSDLNGYIGYQSNSLNNFVKVSNTGSSWTNSESLYVGNSGSGILTIADGGSVIANSGIKVAANIGSEGVINIGTMIGSTTSGQIVGDITFGSGRSTLNFNQNDTNTFTNKLQGSNVTVCFYHGETILSNNNTYAGVNVVQGGVLQTALPGSLGSSTNNLTLLSNGTVNLNATTQSVGNLNMLGGTVTNGTINSTTTTFTPGANTNLFQGTNNDSGAFRINGGNNTINGRINSASFNIANNSTNTINATLSNNTYAADGTLNNTSDAFLITAGNNTITGDIYNGTNLYKLDGGTNLLSGVLYGAGGVALRGGVTTLSNSNCYLGTTLITGSNTIMITASAGALGNSTNTLNLENGATLNLGGTTQTQSNVNIMSSCVIGNGTLNACNFKFDRGENISSASFGNYTSSTGVVQAGNMIIDSGTTTLYGNSSYSGITTVNDNSLLIARSSYAVGYSRLMLRGGNLKVEVPNLIVPNFDWISQSSVTQLSLGFNVIVADHFYIRDTNVNGAYLFNLTNSVLDDEYHNVILDNSDNASANNFGVLDYNSNDFSCRRISILPAYGCSNAWQIRINTTANYIVNGASALNTNKTVNSLTYESNSILILGSHAHLNVTSNYTSSDTGTLAITIEDQGASAPIYVGGTAQLGGNLLLAFTHGTAYGKTYNIISAENLQGAFDNKRIFVLNEGFRARWIDPPTVGYVVLCPTNYTQVACNANEVQVASALNSFMTANSGDEEVVSRALDFLTEAQYPAAFEQIMPALYQSLSTIAFNIGNAQNQELLQRLWGVRLASAHESGSHFSMSGFADAAPLLQGQEAQEMRSDILRPVADNHWSMFVDGNGIFAQASANNLSTYNAESGGVTTGLSYLWNKKVSTGIYSGYQGVYSKYSGGSALIDDQVNFGLFGTYGEENGRGLFMNLLAGGACDNYQMNRNISFGSGDEALNRTAIGKAGAGELNTMLASGYDIQRGNFTFGPLSSLQYQYFGVHPFTETGAESLNLHVNGWETSSMIWSLGSHIAYNWQANKNLLLIPQISLSWQHQFLENPYTMNSTLDYGNSPTFANTSSAPLRDTLYTTIGVTLAFDKNWDTSFFYNAAAGNQDLISQNIFWSLGYKF